MYSSILAVIFLVFWVGNTFFWNQPLLGLALLLWFILQVGSGIGRWLWKDEPALIRWWIGTWMLLSGIMVVGSLGYYLFSFRAPFAYVLFLFSIPIALWLGRRVPTFPFKTWFHDRLKNARHTIPSFVFGISLAVLLFGMITWLLLRDTATSEAIRSPWVVIPPMTFLVFGIATAGVYTLLIRGQERALSIPLVSFVLLIFLSVAALIFPLGFGFDGFIHRATEHYIADHGSITPKPFYYIGHYVLVLFLHHNFSLPIDPIDIWLVPILTALFLPLAFFTALSHLLPERKSTMAALIAIFFLPLSSFISTTPQNLANLWILLLILTAVPILRDRHRRATLLALPTLATLAIHPIAGIPALLWEGLLLARKKKWLIVFLTVIGAVALPTSFLLLSLSTGTAIAWQWPDLSEWVRTLSFPFYFDHQFRPILDFAYLVGANLWLIITGFATAGWWLVRKQLKGSEKIFGFMLVALLVNYLLLKGGATFFFLIDYERSDYADRLLPILGFVLAPWVGVGIGRLWQRLRSEPRSLRAFALLLTSAATVALWYFAYPLNNAYEVGHGINTSQWDFAAVRLIEKESGNKPYAVLANQSVSAAALSEIGFRYFGDQFFYPIPTGSDLYQRFLAMNDQPSRDVVMAAQEDVLKHCGDACEAEALRTVYYVVNDYWTNAKNIIPVAQQTADRWWSVGDGKVMVFEYRLE